MCLLAGVFIMLLGNVPCYLELPCLQANFGWGFKEKLSYPPGLSHYGQLRGDYVQLAHYLLGPTSPHKMSLLVAPPTFLP